MVSNIFYFHPYLGHISILTNIFFQMGWNHQQGYFFFFRKRHLQKLCVFFCDGVLEAGVGKGSILFDGDVTPLKTTPDKGNISKREGSCLPSIIFQGTFVPLSRRSSWAGSVDTYLGGGLNHVLCSSRKFGEMIQFDYLTNIFQMGGQKPPN